MEKNLAALDTSIDLTVQMGLHETKLSRFFAILAFPPRILSEFVWKRPRIMFDARWALPLSIA